MTRPAAVVSTIAALVITAGRTLLAQCSMCQSSLANSENNAGIIGGFHQGIGLLLGVMLLLGITGWRYARRVRSSFAVHQRRYSSEGSDFIAEDSATQ